MEFRLPRPGTRVRAVFEVMLANAKRHKTTRWAEGKAAYDNNEPAYSLRMFGPRYHSGINVSRIMRKYGNKIARGEYSMYQKWIDLVDGVVYTKTPTTPTPLPPTEAKTGTGLRPSISNGCSFVAGDQVVAIEDRDYLQENTRVFKGEVCRVAGWNVLGNMVLEGKTPPNWQVEGGFGWAPELFTRLPNVIELTDPRELKRLYDESVVKVKSLEDKILGLEAEIKIAKGSRDGYLRASDDKIKQLNDVITERTELFINAIDMAMRNVIGIRDSTVYHAPTNLTSLYNALKELRLSLNK